MHLTCWAMNNKKNQIFVINQKSPFSIWWFPWTVLQYACCMICHVFWQNLLLLCLCYDVMWPCAILCWLPGCVIRWHHSWDGIIHEMTSFMWWHLSWDDIIHEMTSVMWWHLSCVIYLVLIVTYSLNLHHVVINM